MEKYMQNKSFHNILWLVNEMLQAQGIHLIKYVTEHSVCLQIEDLINK
jgi:hypothetical protein